jgi:PIN domain nuclease of toxin-antitoxin system
LTLLLDTHMLLWWLAADPRLPAQAAEAIKNPGNAIVVSAATIWEAAIKSAMGRLRIQDSLPEAVADEGFDLLAITPAHAWAQATLPLHHRDPFDRMLVAQARAEGLTLVSVDAAMRLYDVDLMSLS